MELKGGCGYRIEFPIVDRDGNEMAIEIHFDAGRILTKSGSRAQIGIFGFLRMQITVKAKNLARRRVIATSRLVESPMVSTSMYAENAIGVLWFRHGEDVERDVGRINLWEYGGINTNICSKR